VTPAESKDVAFVHATAVVEPGADLGPAVKVWHHAHVRSGARIGAGSQVGKNVYVDAGAIVGERCKIQNNVSVYSGVVLDDDVFVGPSAVFTNDLTPRAFGGWSVTPTAVRRGASIGANATLRCGIVIGQFAMVAAGAVVTKDVADHQLVAGNPARHLGWVCACGAVASRADDRPADVRCARCRTGETEGGS
jgi:acetyltransferase-like isoleucine patch superfamily enzyme